MFTHLPGCWELAWARVTFSMLNERQGLPLSGYISSVRGRGQDVDVILEEERRRDRDDNPAPEVGRVEDNYVLPDSKSLSD